MFICILNIHAHGDSAGKAGYFNGHACQVVNQVRGCCFPWYGGAGRDEDFLNPLRLYPAKKLTDFEFIRPNTLHRSQHSVKDMIHSCKGSGLFNDQQIARFLYHAD